MDPLSDILASLHPHSCVAAGLDAGGTWSIRFERHAGMKCNAVLKGRCWLFADGMDEPTEVGAGDCFILPHGRPFTIGTDGARQEDDAAAIYAPVPHGGTAVYGRGGDFFMAGARFLVAGPMARSLLDPLPPVIVLRGDGRRGTIEWSLDRIAEELREPSPGGAATITHLAHLVMVQVLRLHLREPQPNTGWMAALADPQISRAVAAIHADPARAWTVAGLASLAGLSRTSFAVRFQTIVGQSPIEYLTRWRMVRAAEQLRGPKTPTARIAVEAGYASESAFANAFKRVMGETPRSYGRRVEREGQGTVLGRTGRVP